MNSERHTSYLQAKEQIERAVTKLHQDERDTLLDAAEGLLLCTDQSESQQLTQQATEQLNKLVQSGRWSEPTATELQHKIDGCYSQPVAA